MEINKILPLETFVSILKKLDYKSIIIAQLTCKKWCQIINQFNLVKACLKNQCKFLLFWQNYSYILLNCRTILVKSGIIITGGFNGEDLTSVEVISSTRNNHLHLPSLPKTISGSPSIFQYNETPL